ncbi:MAG: hypothetical protein WCK37_02530 [Candidatus Falkowbacteria bacterium]
MSENFYNIEAVKPENIEVNSGAGEYLAEQVAKSKKEELEKLARLADDFDMENDPEFDRIMDKIDQYGEFSLTAAEHHAIGSTPDDELINNPGKAEYEVIGEEKITKILDSHIKCLNSHPSAYKPGEYEASFELVSKAIPFLKSVGHLPAKYANFDLEALKKQVAA